MMIAVCRPQEHPANPLPQPTRLDPLLTANQSPSPARDTSAFFFQNGGSP